MSTMSTLRAAVIGVGYLGRFHAQKYAAMDGVELSAVVDAQAERADAVAGELGTEPLTDYRLLAGRVDMASVAVPTPQHYDVARYLLEAGVHVLVEKPMTATADQARSLVELAAARERILQIGHLERFNPVMQQLVERVDDPVFIECERVSPFRPRGIDVSVVMDLMIHDIDLILDLVDAPVERVEASGAPVLTSQIDIANARIQFANGCVANVTASRVSQKSERRMRLFQSNAYFSVDLSNGTLDIRRRGDREIMPGIPDIESEHLTLPGGDALADEIRSFISCVRTGRAPVVGGRDGLRALEAVVEIGRQLEANRLTREEWSRRSETPDGGRP